MPADPSIPDLGGLSVDEYVRQNASPGAIQPPPSTAGATTQNFLQRYGSAALRGAEWNTPGAATTLGVGALTGPGVLAAAPLAAGELAVGALGGIAGQAAEDLGAPGWVGPAISGVAGLGASGIPTVGRGLYQLGSRIATNPLSAHTLYGAAIGVGESLATHILAGAAHISSDAGNLIAHGLAATTIPIAASVAAGTRNLLRPIASPSTWQAIRDLGLPFSGIVGAEVGPEGPSASAPIPPRRSTLELSPDQTMPQR